MQAIQEGSRTYLFERLIRGVRPEKREHDYMKTRERHLQITASFCACVCILPLLAVNARAGEIRFTSVPDIFNWNISNPQPGWEDTIDWFLDRLQEEGPDFMLNAGDIMDARWWNDKEQVRKKTEEYWTSVK